MLLECPILMVDALDSHNIYREWSITFEHLSQTHFCTSNFTAPLDQDGFPNKLPTIGSYLETQSGALPPCFTWWTIKKQGLDVEDKKNYQPLLNLAFLSKVLRCIIPRQLLRHISEPLQYTYKPAHSKETALLRIKAYINSALDRGQGVFLL